MIKKVPIKILRKIFYNYSGQAVAATVFAIAIVAASTAMFMGSMDESKQQKLKDQSDKKIKDAMNLMFDRLSSVEYCRQFFKDSSSGIPYVLNTSATLPINLTQLDSVNIGSPYSANPLFRKLGDVVVTDVKLNPPAVVPTAIPGMSNTTPCTRLSISFNIPIGGSIKSIEKPLWLRMATNSSTGQIVGCRAVDQNTCVSGGMITQNQNSKMSKEDLCKSIGGIDATSNLATMDSSTPIKCSIALPMPIGTPPISDSVKNVLKSFNDNIKAVDDATNDIENRLQKMEQAICFLSTSGETC